MIEKGKNTCSDEVKIGKRRKVSKMGNGYFPCKKMSRKGSRVVDADPKIGDILNTGPRSRKYQVWIVFVIVSGDNQMWHFHYG